LQYVRFKTLSRRPAVRPPFFVVRAADAPVAPVLPVEPITPTTTVAPIVPLAPVASK
jgi:hypothetical protein